MRSVPENTKQRFQTKFVQPSNGLQMARDNQMLANMDQDGWELVGIVAPTPVNVVLAFKRPYDNYVDFEHKPEVPSAFKSAPPISHSKRLVSPQPSAQQQSHPQFNPTQKAVRK